MKRIASIFAVILSAMCITSCSVLINNTSSEQALLNVEIFQTLRKGEALAMTTSYDVVKVVSDTDVYYDGKKLSGTYVLIDTYTYETKDERIKTVPVYKRKSELRK